MELWTEYEGRVIDGVFPLEKLVSPEGRSAYFSTLNSKGIPTVIRLIESHFDEEVILARWRKVTALNHPNLLKMEQHGQVVLDETPVVYAVIEPTDANLGEVLNQQRLVVSEVKQLAANLLAALRALHAEGFIHEHVAADNVFAIGEVVKLRSDCIRETPEGAEGQALKRQDFQAIAVVLLQALTQQQTLEEAARDLPLPAPFDQIVRKGLSGEWGDAEISAALDATDHPPAASPAPQITTATPPASSPAVTVPIAKPVPRPQTDTPPSRNIERKEGQHRMGWMVALGLGILLVLWLGWHALHRQSADPTNVPQVTSTPAPDENKETPKPTPASAPTVATTPKPESKPIAKPIPHREVVANRDQWRVIAYKYNVESNAEKKAAVIAQKHPELHPKVFSPTGHTPYLIMVGGIMTRDEAYALVRKASLKGLPSDTYAQKVNDAKRTLPSGN